MKTVWYYPKDEWMITSHHSALSPSPILIPDEGWDLVRQWETSPPSEGRVVSGVLADWLDDHMAPTDEVRRFASTLRFVFENGKLEYQGG